MLESIHASEKIRVGSPFQREGANRDRSHGIPGLPTLRGRGQRKGEAARRHEEQEEVIQDSGHDDV